MSEANKALIKRWFKEVWDEGRVETIDELLLPTAKAHGLADGKPVQQGKKEFKEFHAKLRSALPDIRVEIEDAIAEGDRVAVRCKVTGTHKGCSLGCEATHKAVEFTGITIVRIENGKIVEGWNEYDFLRLYSELGIVKK